MLPVDLSPDFVFFCRQAIGSNAASVDFAPGTGSEQEGAEVRAVHEIIPGQGNSVSPPWEGFIMRNSQCPHSGVSGRHGMLKTISRHNLRECPPQLTGTRSGPGRLWLGKIRT